MNVMQPNGFEIVIGLLMLLLSAAVVAGAISALIYLPKISRQLNRVEKQGPHGQ